MSNYKSNDNSTLKTRLPQWWTIVKGEFVRIFGILNQHFNGLADRHKAADVDCADGNTVEQRFGAYKGTGNNSFVANNPDKNIALTENSVVSGKNNIAGGKAFYYQSIDINNKIVYLSKTQVTPIISSDNNYDSEFGDTGYSVGDEVSIVNGNHYDFCSTIEEVNNNKITLSSIPFDNISAAVSSDNDDWMVYVPAKPAPGNQYASSMLRGAFAEGEGNIASGITSHSEGYGNLAAGNYGHAEGKWNTAGYAAHAEGQGSKATGSFSHTEGYNTSALNGSAHAEGGATLANGLRSHAEGYQSVANGGSSHAEGSGTNAMGDRSHAEGYKTEAKGSSSHSEGVYTEAVGEASHSEGSGTKAYGLAAHSEGYNTTADGGSSHAEGGETSSIGKRSHAEGSKSSALGLASHSEGYNTEANGQYAHAEGNNTIATGDVSHAEGYGTEAQGQYSHSEGYNTKAIGQASHAEGISTIATGKGSHAEGYETQAGLTGYYWKAIVPVYNIIYLQEGYQDNLPDYLHFDDDIFYISDYGDTGYKVGETIHLVNNIYDWVNDTLCMTRSKVYEFVITAIDNNKLTVDSMSNVETNNNIGHIDNLSEFDWFVYSKTSQDITNKNAVTIGKTSHAEGWGTVAEGNNQHVQGKFNKASTDMAHIVGNGTSDSSRSNAHTLDWDGNAWFAGDVYVGSASGSNKDGGSKKLVTEDYVNDNTIGKRAEDTVSAEIFNDYENNETNIAFGHIEGRNNKAIVRGFEITAMGDSKDTVYLDSVEGISAGDNVHFFYVQEDGTIKKIIDRIETVSTAENKVTFSKGKLEAVMDKVSPNAEGVSFSNGKWLIVDESNGIDGNIGTTILDVDSTYTVSLSGINNIGGILTSVDGESNEVVGYMSKASGWLHIVTGERGHAFGYKHIVSGDEAFAEGAHNTASGYAAHAEGQNTFAAEYGAHSEGHNTVASGWASHAEGRDTTASQEKAHVEGWSSKALAIASHAEGYATQAEGMYSHTEGQGTQTTGNQSHAEGYKSKASYASAHAEGAETVAEGSASHSEGYLTQAIGHRSHAEGWNTIAEGDSSHAEGKGALASGEYSHAEGAATQATGRHSHAEGNAVTASGEYSHAEGRGTVASGTHSHAQNAFTIAKGRNQTAIGRFNKQDDNEKYVFIVGNGTDNSKRSNAHTVDWDGNAWFAGDVTVGEDKKKLATEEVVDTKVDKVEGKGLSSNDFTNEYKTKIDSIDPAGQAADFTAEDKIFITNAREAFGDEIVVKNSNIAEDVLTPQNIGVVNAIDGGQVGTGAVTSIGGAVGRGATSDAGGAVGSEAKANGGGAVGYAAVTGDGGAIGRFARAGDGFAGGSDAVTMANGTPIDAIQLGTGTNANEKTLQVYDYQLLDADGTIPAERLTKLPIKDLSGQQVSPTGGTTVTASEGATIIGDLRDREFYEYYPDTAQKGSVASGLRSIVIGGQAGTASGDYAVVIGGIQGVASGRQSCSLMGGKALGKYSLAWSMPGSAISGRPVDTTTAQGDNSIAIGNSCISKGVYSISYGNCARSNGGHAIASGSFADADGGYAIALGSHTNATGDYATSIGFYTDAKSFNTVFGKYNKETISGTSSDTTGDALVIGNGTNSNALSNAFKIGFNGDVWAQGDMYIGSTSGTDKDEGSKKVATEEFVLNAIQEAIANLAKN